MASIFQLTSDTYIAEAIRDIILGLHITPQTTLTSDVLAVNNIVTIPVTSSLRFNVGSLINFHDDAGEEYIPLLSKTSNSITLDFTGMGYPSLLNNHSQNTVVYSNLFIDAPNDADPMVISGDPVIFVMAADEEESLVAMRQVQSLYTFHIEYRRSLVRPQGVQMDTNVWAFRQQEKARMELNQIANALRTNPHLQTQKGNIAESLGDRTNSRAWITKSWRKLGVNETMDQFIAYMNVIVRAFRQTF